MTGSTNESLILATLDGKPVGMHNRVLAHATGLGIHTVGSILGRLLDRRAIVWIGSAAAAGVDDCAPNVKMYALTGTKMLPRKRELRQRQGSAKGSGQYAEAISVGRGSVWRSGGA